MPFQWFVALRYMRDARGQTLLIPQLLLVMLSTGIAPVQAFPSWLGAFVRHQPVSVIAETLRGLSVGEYRHLPLSLAWCVGLLVLFGVAVITPSGNPAHATGTSSTNVASI